MENFKSKSDDRQKEVQTASQLYNAVHPALISADGHAPNSLVGHLPPVTSDSAPLSVIGTLARAPWSRSDCQLLDHAYQRLEQLHHEQGQHNLTWEQELRIQRQIWNVRLPHNMHIKGFEFQQDFTITDGAH